MPKLRLKDLRLNQVPFYYQTYDGTVDEVDEDGNLTGESIPKYSNPVRVLARVSPNSGNAEDSPFGKDIFGITGFFFNLFPQTAHMDIDRLGVGRAVKAPHQIQ